ncbi:hypothetical protein [Gillisia sp. CAL575]|uniref:hypothetical protein n=1 Tax=Gillisia sp. CAL575 TaxID=985255 RepID=UPI0003A932C6|nr:hypothetical protein [Gillisia sp. CAL575]
MKFQISFIIFLLSFFASAQKDTSRQIDAKEIESIYIDTDEVFKIIINTSSKSDLISISSHSEGEYFNDIALNTEVKKSSVYLSTKFQEILQSGFDKLSAHKVFSLEITLEIPEGMQVFVKSNIASVEAEGVFDFIQVQLKSGYCNLSSFEGNALVNTFNGAITIETTDATVTASSRNGKVILPSVFAGKNSIKVASINGDIRIVEN